MTCAMNSNAGLQPAPGRFTMWSIVINRQEIQKVRDLEIYIRDLESSAVSSWLASHLDDIELRDDPLGDRAVKGSAHYRAHRVRINLYPGAGGKRYTSVILEGEDLPWVSDLDCARSAWRAMDTEIRCSPGDWKEGEPVEDEKWWRLDQRGEQLAVWN